MVTLDTGVGSKWALALEGRGYLLSTLDEQSPFEFRAYTLEPIPLRLPRIDFSDEPGEQSIGSLWPRAQHSWHEGAGQEIFDSEFSSRFKVLESVGVNLIKEKGVLHLNPKPTVNDTDRRASNMIMVGDNLITYSDVPVEFQKFTAKDEDPQGTVTTVDPYRYGRYRLASDGEKVYILTDGSTGIQTLDTTTDWSTPPTGVKVNDLVAGDVLGFVKGRLMVGKGGSIHEITDLTSLTSGATALWTHMYSGWQYTVFAETGPGIFAAGYAPGLSELLFISFDASDASAGVTIGVPKVAWEAPTGEKILSLSSYLGAAMLMGTSRGLRNVIVGSAGDVQVSPLIVETPAEVTKVEAGSRFGYFNYGEPPNDTNYRHIGIVDLSTLAWSLYCSAYATSVECMDLVLWDDEVVWINGGAVEGYILHPNNEAVVTEGWVDSGEIRFGTSENKFLRKMDIVMDGAYKALHILDGDDVFVSSNSLKVVTIDGHDSDNDVRSAVVKVILDEVTDGNSVWFITHGEPYATGVAEEYPSCYWQFGLVNNAGKLYLRFRFYDGLSSTYKIATSTESIDTVATDGEYVWFRMMMKPAIADDHYEVRFDTFLGDDPPGIWVQLGTIIDGGVVAEISHELGDPGAPFYFGGYQATDTLGDWLYVAKVWEYYGSTFWYYQVLDWSSDFPYVDDDGNTYKVIPRLYNATDDVWEEYEVTNESNPLDNIRLGSGQYAEVFIQVDEGEWNSLGNFYGKHTKDLGIEYLGTRFKVKIRVVNTIPSGLTQISRGLLEWRLRSEPIPTPRYFRHFVPIMLYDRMVTIDNHSIAREGYAASELALLKGLYREGDLLDFQAPDRSDAIKVRIDELHFKEFAPPKGARGFGGIALLVLREQE